MMTKWSVVASMVLALLVSYPVICKAQGADGVRLRQLEERMRLMQQELETIKEGQAAPGMSAAKPGMRFPFGVDFGVSITVRYDITEVEDETDILLEDNQVDGFRTRDRLWARFHPDGPVHAGIRLSTGGDPNPTSPFVRFTNLFRSKSFNLDQFYLVVHPVKFFDKRPLAELPVNVSFHAGKMPQPFWLGKRGAFTSEMIWDADVNPEGVALKISAPKILPFLGLESTTAYFLVEEVDDLRFSGLTADTYLIATQLKLEVKPATLAFTFYNYEKLNAGLQSPNFIPGEGAFVEPGEDAFLLRSGLQRTNNQLTFGPGAVGFVEEDFQLINLTGQVYFGIPGLPSVAPEIFFVGDYVNNLSVNEDEQGYGLTIGLRAGGQKGSGINPFNLWFTYRNVDNDATLATFADSDLGAGTGYRGVEVGANYRLHRNLLFQFVYLDFRGFPDKDNEITRLFFDLVATF